MSKLRLEEQANYLPTHRAAKELGLSAWQLRLRIKRRVLPPPTQTKKDGTLLFSREWMEEAKKELQRSHARQ